MWGIKANEYLIFYLCISFLYCSLTLFLLTVTLLQICVCVGKGRWLVLLCPLSINAHLMFPPHSPSLSCHSLFLPFLFIFNVSKKRAISCSHLCAAHKEVGSLQNMWGFQWHLGSLQCVLILSTEFAVDDPKWSSHQSSQLQHILLSRHLSLFHVSI